MWRLYEAAELMCGSEGERRLWSARGQVTPACQGPVGLGYYAEASKSNGCREFWKASSMEIFDFDLTFLAGYREVLWLSLLSKIWIKFEYKLTTIKVTQSRVTVGTLIRQVDDDDLKYHILSFIYAAKIYPIKHIIDICNNVFLRHIRYAVSARA